MPRHLLADNPGGQAGRISERLIVLFDNALKEFRAPFPGENSALMVRRATVRRYRPRVDRFIVSNLVKTHIKGMESGSQVLTEQRHEHRRVDTAGEKRRQRDVALQVDPERIGENAFQPLYGFFFSGRLPAGERPVPKSATTLTFRREP
jgi:hypothetical protein